MKSRSLAVDGAVEFTAPVFSDERGFAVQVFEAGAFTETIGHPLFPVKQVLSSRSRRGVVRGVHFTETPPGSAKYVHCIQGSALDIVIDVRVGSPTFGKWDAVLLGEQEFRTVYFPVGVGHAFIALEDDTIMSYLLSREYVAEGEIALQALDPQLGLPIPGDMDLIMSERDRVAQTFAEAEAAGILPDYALCKDLEAGKRP